MTFIAELFVQNIISDDIFFVLLKPAKSLSYNALMSLLAVISPKVVTNKNARLAFTAEALNKNAHERSVKFLKELKKDIKDLIVLAETEMN